LSRISHYVREPEKLCIADRLAPLYRVTHEACGDASDGIEVALACGGCPACRAIGRHRPNEPAILPHAPWQLRSELLPPADRILDSTGRVLVFYDQELDKMRPPQRRTVVSAFAQLVRCGFANIHLESYPLDPADLGAALKGTPIFVGEGRDARFLPPGHTLVLVGSRTRVTERLLDSYGPSQGRVVLLPSSTPDLELEGSRLRDRYPSVRKLRLEDMLTELGL
jgi:hypothetical protein